MSDLIDVDSESLAKARQTFGRWNLWFWLFIAGIPLGFIVPLALAVVAFKIWGSDVSAPIGLSGLLWPIVGVAGALLVRGARKRARRALGIAIVADSRGWQFTARPALPEFEFLKSVSFMENPHTQSGKNLVSGRLGQIPWISLDYEYTYFYGSVTEIGEQTLVVFLQGFSHVPPLAIVPRGIAGRLEDFFLGRGNVIESRIDKQFNRQFSVYGDDAPTIQRYLSRDMLDIFLDDRKLIAVVEEDRLYVFRRLTYVSADDYSSFLANAQAIAELLLKR